MPPVQRTFSIVPDGAGIAAAAGVVETTRPMTSKQARKAYKQKTKGPTMSRAEWRRWERAEQERIRKELDKDRAASKAKAARERKKEKESSEREEKRKNGLPLVSVRPSQDTIARFVRGKESRKRRDSGGQAAVGKLARRCSPVREDAESEVDAGLDVGGRMTKKEEEAREGADMMKEEENGDSANAVEGLVRGPDIGDEPMLRADFADLEMDDQKTILLERGLEESAIDGHDQAPATDTKPRFEDDSFLDGWDLDIDDCDMPLLDQITSAAAGVKDIPPEHRTTSEIDLLSEGEDFELELLALEATTPRKEPSQPRKPTSFENDLGLSKARLDRSVLEIPPPSPKPPEKRPMCPPPPPPAASPPARPPPLLLATSLPQPPPLSTQAIFANVDDFFPTASQLELELQSSPAPASPPSRPSSGPLRPPPAPQPDAPTKRLPSSPGSPKKRFFSSFYDEHPPISPPRRQRLSPHHDAIPPSRLPHNTTPSIKTRNPSITTAPNPAPVVRPRTPKPPSPHPPPRPVLNTMARPPPPLKPRILNTTYQTPPPPKLRVMNTVNEPKLLLHEAEKKLAAIRHTAAPPLQPHRHKYSLLQRAKERTLKEKAKSASSGSASPAPRFLHHAHTSHLANNTPIGIGQTAAPPRSNPHPPAFKPSLSRGAVPNQRPYTAGLHGNTSRTSPPKQSACVVLPGTNTPRRPPESRPPSCKVVAEHGTREATRRDGSGSRSAVAMDREKMCSTAPASQDSFDGSWLDAAAAELLI